MLTLDDAVHQRIIAALWVLLRSADADDDSSMQSAAEDCARECRLVTAGASHCVVQEKGGALWVNGRRVRPDVQAFAATAGIAGLMQECGITEMLVDGPVTAVDFIRLARCWVSAGPDESLEGMLLASGCRGIHVAQGDEPGPLARPMRDHDGRDAASTVDRAPSLLGAMFTMQQLSTALDTDGPLSGPLAYSVVQSVVDRLLQNRSCLSPLAEVERAPLAHREALRACVLATRAAQALEWHEDRCQAAGAEALLGTGLGIDSDGEVAELARAARAVAALLDVDHGAHSVLEQLALHGQLPSAFAEAMGQALAI